MSNLITLKQKPIIEFSAMEARGLEVAEEIRQLNLDTIEPTEENRSMMKKIRAKLNKELGVFEEQRKMIHGLITKPYKEFTDSYESNIKFLYVDAEKQLKEKISVVEEQMLANKKSDIESYFKKVNKFSFLTLDSLGLNIILSASDKKLFEQIDDFLAKIKADVDAISKMDNSIRILSMYENTMDLSGSVSKVLADIEQEKRLESERLERERIAKENEEKRAKQALIDAENEAKERAERKKIEAEQAEQARIQAEKNAALTKTKEAEEALKRAEMLKQEAEKQAIEAQLEESRMLQEKKDREKKAALEAKIFTMSFKVSGTMSQLKQIKEFLNTIGVSYE